VRGPGAPSTIQIGPGLTIMLEFMESAAYSAEQSASIHAGTLQVYVLGMINYHDVFGTQARREADSAVFGRPIRFLWRARRVSEVASTMRSDAFRPFRKKRIAPRPAW
jgi:hypothetical protein